MSVQKSCVMKRNGSRIDGDSPYCSKRELIFRAIKYLDDENEFTFAEIRSNLTEFDICRMITRNISCAIYISRCNPRFDLTVNETEDDFTFPESLGGEGIISLTRSRIRESIYHITS